MCPLTHYQMVMLLFSAHDVAVSPYGDASILYPFCFASDTQLGVNALCTSGKRPQTEPGVCLTPEADVKRIRGLHNRWAHPNAPLREAAILRPLNVHGAVPLMLQF